MKSIVACYSLSGDLVKIYPSALEASRSRKLHSRTIDKAIRNNLIVKGLIWRRFDKENVPSKIEVNSEIKTIKDNRIICYDLNGNYVKTYKSIRDASISLGKSEQVIRDCLKGKYKTAYGYKWRYKSR